MIPSQVRIFVCTERQDMRRSFDGLALAVKERLALDPQSGALFVFASKRGNRLKVLWFDHNGYCLLYKSMRSTKRVPRTPMPPLTLLRV
jgi:transposase